MSHAIILAAGKSERFGKADKLLVEISGKPLLYYTLMAFNDHPEVSTITLVVNRQNATKIKEIVRKYRFPKVKKYVFGARTRQESVKKGLNSLKVKSEELILVHNGANPLPSQSEISECLKKAKKVGACIVGHFLTSTIKEVGNSHVLKTHDRKKLFAAETPQCAKFGILKNALKKALSCTDEAMALEAAGQKIAFVKAGENNFKITTEKDLLHLKSALGEVPADFLVGIGQDSHQFDKNKGLTLAGLKFPQELKLKANSDGDVILHAIFNAISQAIGEKSLGFYDDKEFKKGITDSQRYLEPLLKKLVRKNLKINSLGLMLECKAPKIDPINSKLKKNLSKILSLPLEKIGITATSGEELTAFGQGHGIQCFAIISLTKQQKASK